MKAIVSKEAVERFIRRAKRHYPKECLAALWGTIGVGEFHIVEFCPMRGHGDKNTVEYTKEETRRQKGLARLAGYVYLGTAHTHPHKDYDQAPSSEDHLSAIQDGDLVVGILHLWKNDKKRWEYTMTYWQPQKPLQVTEISTL